MPGLVLLMVGLYVAVCLYRPMRPFESRREVVRYGIPGLIIAAILLAIFSPLPDEAGEEVQAVVAPPPPPTPEEISRQQQLELIQRRTNKIRAREDERMDAQMREAARVKALQTPSQ